MLSSSKLAGFFDHQYLLKKTISALDFWHRDLKNPVLPQQKIVQYQCIVYNLLLLTKGSWGPVIKLSCCALTKIDLVKSSMKNGYSRISGHVFNENLKP